MNVHELVFCSLSLWFKSDICWYLKWEDVPLGVGNSHCDTTGYSAAQWEPLDLDGVNTLTISAQISSAMMVAVVNTVTEAAAASLLSRPRLTPDSGLSPLRSISIPTPAALASPGWRQCTRGKKAGERRERGEIPPGNERGGGEGGRGRRGDCAQHSPVLENGDMLSAALTAPSLLNALVVLSCSRFYIKRLSRIMIGHQYCRKVQNFKHFKFGCWQNLDLLGMEPSLWRWSGCPGPAQRKLGSVRRVAKFQTF